MLAWARTLFFGWWIVAGSMGIQFVLAGLFFQAYGTYAPFWMEEFGWSKTTIALAFALHRTESGLLGPLHGWMLERFEPRRLILAGVILLGVGFVTLGFATGLGTFFAAIFCMAIGSSLAGILPLMTVIVQWFDRRRATALAFMQSGMNLGGLVVPVVAGALITFGWRPTAMASGFVILAVGVPLSRMFYRDPESRGLLPDGAPSGSVEHVRTASPAMPRDFTTRAALATREFWLISAGQAAAVAIVSAVLVHFVLFLTSDLGYTIPAAAAVFAFMTAVSFVSQLLGGVLGDAVDKRVLVSLAMTGHVVAMLLLAWIPSATAVFVAAAVHGVAWGLRGPSMGAMRVDYFGRTSFATIMGFSSVIIMLGSVSGPLVAAAIADRTGSYAPAFLTLAVVAAVGAGLFAMLGAPRLASNSTSAVGSG